MDRNNEPFVSNYGSSRKNLHKEAFSERLNLCVTSAVEKTKITYRWKAHFALSANI